MSDRDGQTSDVLAGIRVLDFGRYIAGPYCAPLDAVGAMTAGWRRSPRTAWARSISR